MASTGIPLARTAAPNVTPLIDVMLVLLIIFMVITPLVPARGPALLPWAAAGEPADETIAVGIDRAGTLSLDDTPIAAAALEATLRSLQRRGPIDGPLPVVALRADRDLPYAHIAHAMAVIQRAGYTRVALVTQSHDR